MSSFCCFSVGTVFQRGYKRGYYLFGCPRSFIQGPVTDWLTQGGTIIPFQMRYWNRVCRPFGRGYLGTSIPFQLEGATPLPKSLSNLNELTEKLFRFNKVRFFPTREAHVWCVWWFGALGQFRNSNWSQFQSSIFSWFSSNFKPSVWGEAVVSIVKVSAVVKVTVVAVVILSSQAWYLSNLLHQHIFQNLEIYPKKCVICNISYSKYRFF